jgi:hypothetical protein
MRPLNPRCVFSAILQEQGVHRTLEPDVQVRNVALSERDDVHARECEPLEETRGVFLVAAEAVQRFGKHDIESAVQRIAHQRLEARAQQRRTGDRVVGVLLADRPALSLGVPAAHAQLIRDRRVALVVRRVPRVEGDFHGLHLIEFLTIVASVPARSIRGRPVAPARGRTDGVKRLRRCRRVLWSSLAREPSAVGRVSFVVVVFRP